MSSSFPSETFPRDLENAMLGGYSVKVYKHSVCLYELSSRTIPIKEVFNIALTIRALLLSGGYSITLHPPVRSFDKCVDEAIEEIRREEEKNDIVSFLENANEDDVIDILSDERTMEWVEDAVILLSPCA